MMKTQKKNLLNLHLGSVNKKGFNFIFESIIIAMLVLLIVIGFINYTNVNEENSKIPMMFKINDAFVVLSKLNKEDVQKEMKFMFPKEDVELYVDDIKVFGKTNPKTEFCIVRDENIAIINEIESKIENFRIKYCQ